jgi:stage II sporulation protein D
MTRAALLTVLIALLAAPNALADVRVDGHGWGHGVGLSQYGAMGYAAREGRDYRWILGHYYPGTQVRAVKTARVRVRLKEAAAQRVKGAAKLRGANGRRVSLRTRRTYRFSANGGRVRVISLSNNHTLARLPAPVRVTAGNSPLKLLGKAENGVKDGAYRGALTLSLHGKKVLAVDDVALEDYLRGVVAGEMPASWPAQALAAQAVAARSYALTHRGANPAFDVYADTRSQVYGGVSAEAPAASAAVRATKQRAVVTADGRIAETLFHSSSGGRTAAVEEVFTSSPPIAYLQSVDDPYDAASPYHDWTVTMSNADTQKQLGLLVPGQLTGIAVTATTPSGRARTVHITGTLGAVDADADAVQSALGLRSTWFTISFS